jgi:hypothetical protein
LGLQKLKVTACQFRPAHLQIIEGFHTRLVFPSVAQRRKCCSKQH